MNYLKSEQFRLIRKKELYLTISISLGLVIAAILALYLSLQADGHFPYGTNRFLYLNVLSVFPLILLIGFLVSRQLLGSDISMVKQSVAFGISRNRIFFTKLVLTLTEFLLLCSSGILITLLGGELLLTTDAIWKTQFLISVFNLIPLTIGGFVLGFTLMCLTENEVVSALLTLLLFNGAFSEVVSFLEKRIFDHSMLSSFLPGALIKQNTEQFLAKSASITTENWLIGTIVILISLSIGITIYNKKNL